MKYFKSVMRHVFLGIIFLMIFNLKIFAQEAPALVSPALLSKEGEGIIDMTHNRLSNSLFYLSNRIDSFFGGERADNLPNGSRVRLSSTINQEEGTALMGEVAVRLNLALVETEKKLIVSFKNKYEKDYEKYKAEQESIKEKKGILYSQQQAPKNLNDLLNWRLKLDSGRSDRFSSNLTHIFIFAKIRIGSVP